MFKARLSHIFEKLAERFLVGMRDTIFESDLELENTKFFTIYILLEAVDTAD